MFFEETSRGGVGAYYSSVKTKGDFLYRHAKFEGALEAYDEALALNPRSKTILIDKAKCHTEMGKFDKALYEVDTALARLQSSSRKPPNNWSTNNKATKSGGHARDRVKEELEHPANLTYKCRYLLSKADALYNKGDFEGALVFYHKGRKLRPNAEEFRLGVQKSEEALESFFPLKSDRKEKRNTETETDRRKDTKTEKDKEKDEKEGSEKAPEEKVNKNDKEEKPKENEKGIEDEKSKEESDKKNSSDPDKTGEEPQKADGEKEASEKDEHEEKTERGSEKRENEESQEVEETVSKKQILLKPEPPYHLDRKERVKEMRLAYSIREREHARKARLKMQMLTRPSQHLQDDKQFLEVLYKDFALNAGRKNKKVKNVTKEAISYLDTRNRFWTQQIPHHIREKSTVMKKGASDPSKTGPPPTQALYTFVIKEMLRINNMLAKNQYHRTIDNAKKLIDHINQMERNIPNKFNILANLFSIIGQAYLELGDCKKALAFHMKDLQLSTELDLDEAKSRALDNTGRVFARTGEFAKAIAVWEQKLQAPFPIAPSEKAWLCHEMGYCYIEIEGFEKARECGEKSLEAAKEAGDKQWQLNASILIAQAMLHAGEAYLSKEAFEKALKFAIEADDTKAKDSIEPALEEINKVIAEWKELEKDVKPQQESEKQHDKPPSEAPRESSTKSTRTQSDWLLDDDVTDDAAGSSVVTTNEQQTKANRKRDSAVSKTDTTLYTKRKSVAAVYVGGKDSDFCITTSAESADEEKDKSAAKHSGNKSETKSSAANSNNKPPKHEQSLKITENRKSRWDYGKANREVSFTRSPKTSPIRSPHREASFVGKPRREASFARNSKRDSAENSGSDTRMLSPEEKIARTTAVYTYSRELSNVSARTSIKREKSNLSLKNSRKNKSTTDLSRNATSPERRRKGTTGQSEGVRPPTNQAFLTSAT